MSTTYVPGALQGQKRHWIPCNWNVGKHRSSLTTSSAFNQGAVSPDPVLVSKLKCYVWDVSQRQTPGSKGSAVERLTVSLWLQFLEEKNIVSLVWTLFIKIIHEASIWKVNLSII